MNKQLIALAILFFPSCVIDGSLPEMSEEIHDDGQSLYTDLGDAKHCVVEVLAAPKNEPVPNSRSFGSSPRCFRHFSEAIEFATRGRVRLPRAATVDDVDDNLLNDTEPDTPAVNVIGIEYEHRDFGGATFTYESQFTCATHSFSISSMPSGWNDRISSARAFSGCNHSYHYEHNAYQGAVTDCQSECSYVGDALNDRTSSIYWTQ